MKAESINLKHKQTFYISLSVCLDVSVAVYVHGPAHLKVFKAKFEVWQLKMVVIL